LVMSGRGGAGGGGGDKGMEAEGVATQIFEHHGRCEPVN